MIKNKVLSIINIITNFVSLGKCEFFILLVGLLVRFVLFSHGRTFWWDEAHVANRVIDASFLDLLLNIKENYYYPPGFLIVQKTAAFFLGQYDYVLRLFPFLCGVAALFIFRRVISKYVEGWGGVLGMLVFAIAPLLAWFSTEAKHYATDVLVVVLWLGILRDLRKGTGDIRQNLTLVFLGMLSIFFSMRSAVLLASSGAGLIVCRVCEGKNRRWPSRGFLTVYFAWITYIFLFFMIYMRNYFVSHSLGEWAQVYLFPGPILSREFLFWVDHALPRFLFEPLCYNFWATGILVFAGAVYFWHDDKEKFWILVPPVCTLILMGVIGYPLVPRLILFIFPVYIILMSGGIVGLSRAFPRWFSSIVVGLCIFTLIQQPFFINKTECLRSFMPTDIKPFLNIISVQRRSGDRIYVYDRAWPVVKFYAPLYGINQGEYIKGRGSQRDPTAYVRDVESIGKNERVWLILYKDDDLALASGIKARCGRRLSEIHVIAPETSIKNIPKAYLVLYSFTNQ